jgi:integrase
MTSKQEVELRLGNRRGALHRFSDAIVKGLPNGMHSDGGGLILQVDGGSRRWRFRYTREGRTHYVLLGAYPDRKLAEARARAAECRNLLADGTDPKAEWERRAAAERDREHAATRAAQREAATLEAVARAYHAAHLHEWTEKHGGEWLRSLENHVFPKLGARPVAEIRAVELLDLLQPLRAANPETGQRIRQRLDAIFADAIVRELCEGNPAAAIVKALRQKRRIRRHFAAMPPADVPKFIATLRGSNRLGVSVALAFEFLILTAARTSEVLGATWDEIDTQRRTWTIAAARMKARQPHVVYLTDRALEILRQAHTLRAVDPATGGHKPGDVVFPSPQRPTRPLSNMAFLNALARLGLWGTDVDEAQRVTVHGFRAAFSTWANEQHFPPDVIEAALAHSEKNAVRAAYNRAEYVEQRKRLAEAWAEFCEGGKPKRLRVVGGRK